jgi:hypothetical protein
MGSISPQAVCEDLLGVLPLVLLDTLCSVSKFTSGDPIDNPYFPLKPGTIYTYEGEPADEEEEEYQGHWRS